MGANKGDRITIKSTDTGATHEGTIIGTRDYVPGNGYGYVHKVHTVEKEDGGTEEVRVGRDGNFVKEDGDPSYSK